MKKIVFLIAILSTIRIFSWQTLFSVEGNCRIDFPQKPHHMHQVIPIRENNTFMKYDVYLSEIEEENSMCMLVITHFPDKVDEAKQTASLEGFLNGILNHNQDKKLIFAEFTDFQNRNALDFLVQNKERLFKGKAILDNDKLYLVTLEYDSNKNLDLMFDKFLSSFSIND
ncbi:MAG: hypothetical protein JXA94_00285 [Parachlamydiales bacterium]|nr:hypothetical protein [Parachlamydiales bacterium]